MQPTIPIAIFASGAGSNALTIIDTLAAKNSPIKVALIVCNNPAAGVLAIAQKKGIPTLLIEKEPFFRGNAYVAELQAHHIHFIVLAGFLWKIPPVLIKAFEHKIINIHPALLPKYGGKGMYGQRVHQAVIDHGDTQSGISIHWVDEQYDHGNIIFQATCPVLLTDTSHTLAQRIHALEHTHYARVIQELLINQSK